MVNNQSVQRSNCKPKIEQTTKVNPDDSFRWICKI